jgi:anti-sigma regulatory factor (Ser/Thr protein kinase)
LLINRAVGPAQSLSASIEVNGANDLVHARPLMAEVARRAGLEHDRVDQLTVALSEIATNAILHGGGRAQVSILGDRASVIVDVRDQGPGILAEPALARTHPAQLNGRGLWLARQLCDDQQVRSSATGTLVRLVMRLGGMP